MSEQPVATTEPQAPTTPVEPGSAEYNAEMAAKWMGSIGPDKIPEPFRGEDGAAKLLQAFQDTKAELTRTQQTLSGQQVPESVPEPAAAPSSLKVEEVETPVEFDWTPYEQEFASTGTLGPKAREDLKKAMPMLNDTIIDSYVAGLRAKQNEIITTAANLVGGNDELQATLKWAKDKLSSEEKASINAALSGPGWETALLGLQARRKASDPTAAANEPSRQFATSAAGTSREDQAFANAEQMSAAIRDPRYKTDPEYRTWVEEKIRRTGDTRSHATRAQ